MKWIFLAGAMAMLPATAAQAAPAPSVPKQLNDAQREGYRTVLNSIRAQRWDDAKIALSAMQPGPLHSYLKAEFLTAKGSPKADVSELLAVLAEAPELPQAGFIAKLASERGASSLPPLPAEQRLTWTDGAPVRSLAKAYRNDTAAANLAVKMRPLIKEDRGEEAEALLDTVAANLSPEALTEWNQRVAFMYYIAGNDAAARRMAGRAASGGGDWAQQARWTEGLAAWRQKDCKTAGKAFETVALRASDTEWRAAGLYWSARADMVCGTPEKIEARLKNAAQLDETFYGLIARQALGIRDTKNSAEAPGGANWQSLAQRPNVRVAAALAEIGELDRADDVVRQQAKIGNVGEFSALTKFAGDIGLPGTQVYLASNTPSGIRTAAVARYPAPPWTPDGGWRVDKSLVYAHTLQESRFRTSVVSPAGAYGLMQIMPAAATDFIRATGRTVDRASLTNPGTNIEVGQRHLEMLRDTGITGGLLPKVIAAYNAGPAPVRDWNMDSRDGGDPLLYIESIPFWETRGYVAIVLRNYWMYERNAGKPSLSRAALAQGLWPKFPGMAGANSVRLRTAVAPPRLRPLPPPPLAPVEQAPSAGNVAAASSALLGSN